MKENLNFAAFYPHSPERIWQAITDQKELENWLLPAEFEARVGFRFNIGSFSGEVIEVEAPRRLAYTWNDGETGTHSVVTWQLDPVNGGTLVHLEHASPFDVEPVILIEAGMNWRSALQRLVPVPIVYAEDEPTAPVLARAGFRQEEPCRAQ